MYVVNAENEYLYVRSTNMFRTEIILPSETNTINHKRDPLEAIKTCQVRKYGTRFDLTYSCVVLYMFNAV